MPIPTHQFGSTTIAKVNSASELRELLDDPWLDSETIVIKPNWISTDPADFTDADSMRMLFEALNSRLIVTESYCLTRLMNLLKKGKSFTIGNREVNWKWLLKGEGWSWLIENPDWEWFKSGGHWEQAKKEDQAFLDENGFTDLFREFDVTYINVTEEVWNGRIADPLEVKGVVEERFKPIQAEELYRIVPKKLFDLRGSTFISFAKLKMYASFTMKNLFGLIPDPLRPWWHGSKNTKIAQSIVDINKIYHSIFNVYGICEALRTTGCIDPDGEYEGIFSGKYNLAEGKGIVVFGRDLACIDSILLHLSDPSKRLIAKVNSAPIELAQDEFGSINEEMLEDSRRVIGDWF